jgi:hypothetical protein
MARPQVVDGEDGLQIWRVAANILNKQSRTADTGWSSSLGVGRWLTTHHHKTPNLLQNKMTASDQDGFLGTNQAPKNGYEIWHLECQEPLQNRLIEDSSEGAGKV